MKPSPQNHQVRSENPANRQHRRGKETHALQTWHSCAKRDKALSEDNQVIDLQTTLLSTGERSSSGL